MSAIKFLSTCPDPACPWPTGPSCIVDSSMYVDPSRSTPMIAFVGESGAMHIHGAAIASEKDMTVRAAVRRLVLKKWRRFSRRLHFAGIERNTRG